MEQVKLTRKGGTLKIDIDGQLFEPLSFKSFRPTKRNISDFYKAGVRVFSILSSGMISMLGIPYSLYGESWIGDHEYDFSVVDRQIELFTENAPDAYFALMVSLDTRPWYLEKHPEKANTFTHLSQTVADEEWRKDAADYLQAVLKHVEEKYGDRFYGYFMLCGFTTEWMSQFDEEVPSKSKLEAFARACGPDAVMPSPDDLDFDASQAFPRSEAREAVTRYRRFHAELVADSLLWFAGKAQEVLRHKKLLGVYFGYLFELENARLWNAGHLAYEKVFTSPDIDMISSPSSYAYRAQDSTSAFMVTYDTLDKHDKLYYFEFDHITYLAPSKVSDVLIPGGHVKLNDARETLNVMRRDFMLTLTKGAALWWFDMFEGWFYDDTIMQGIADMIALQKELSAQEVRSNAEILVVAQGETLYGVNKKSRLNDLMLGFQREGLARMGAPYDTISMCDLAATDASKYKLIVFLDALALTKEQRETVNALKGGGRTLLWIYAPDYLSGGTARIQELTDMNVIELIGEENSVDTPVGTLRYEFLPRPRFFVEDSDAVPLGVYPQTEKVAIGMKRFGDYTSIYSAVTNLSGAVLRQIAVLAGVKVYNDEDKPVYVNSLLTGVYSLTPTTLYLPDGEYEELFTGTRYTAENGRLAVPETECAAKLFKKV